MAAPRIALIHATALSIAPTLQAFADRWPGARTTNLLDDSLSADLAAGASEAAMIERFGVLSRYVLASGADAVLFTCSAFGRPIEAARAGSPVPMLKPNEAMLDEALAAGRRIGVLATFGPTLPSIRAEFVARAAELGLPLDLVCREVPGAMAALDRGDSGSHDGAIAEAARGLADCDVVALAQFSMARARALAADACGCPVLTTPGSAVDRLKTLLASSTRKVTP